MVNKETHRDTKRLGEWTVYTKGPLGNSIHTSASPKQTYLLVVLKLTGENGYRDLKDKKWILQNGGEIRIYFGSYGDFLTHYVLYPSEKLPEGYNEVVTEWVSEHQARLTTTAHDRYGNAFSGEPVELDLQELLSFQTPQNGLN